MKNLSGWKIKALLVLSGVILVGVLIALRLTVPLFESRTPDRIIMEPIYLKIDRPRMSIEYGFTQQAENLFTSQEGSVKGRVLVASYLEDMYGSGGFVLLVSVNASFTSEVKSAFTIRLHPMDNKSTVLTSTDFITEQNVTVTHIRQRGTTIEESNITAQGEKSSLFLSAQAEWFYYTDQYDHQLKVVFDFTYQGESVYKKLQLPIFLEIRHDAGKSFETAENITPGGYNASLDNVDYVDMYKLMAEAGQKVNVTLSPPADANFDLYLYDFNYRMAGNSTLAGNAHETFSFTVNETGIYYVKVTNVYWPGHASIGVYELKIGVVAP